MVKGFFALGLLFLLLASCVSKSVLFYDDAFAVAEPAVVSTWKALPPWKGAQTVYLTPASISTLVPLIKTRAPSTGLVIAVFLPSSDRLELTTQFPHRRLIFVGGQATPGTATATVSPREAWTAVAQAAAQRDPSAAWVLYPEDAAPESRAAFAESWRSHGGKSLLEWQWPDPAPHLKPYRQGFDWAGPEADSLVLQAASDEVIHGLAPLSGVGIKPGVDWTVSPTQLVHALYQASTALNSHSITVAVKTQTQSR